MALSLDTFYTHCTAKARYANLERDREAYRTRAVRNAKLTIPMIFPDTSDNAFTNYETPYQSIGARGVNNLGFSV